MSTVGASVAHTLIQATSTAATREAGQLAHSLPAAEKDALDLGKKEIPVIGKKIESVFDQVINGLKTIFETLANGLKELWHKISKGLESKPGSVANDLPEKPGVVLESTVLADRKLETAVLADKELPFQGLSSAETSKDVLSTTIKNEQKAIQALKQYNTVDEVVSAPEAPLATIATPKTYASYIVPSRNTALGAAGLAAAAGTYIYRNEALALGKLGIDLAAPHTAVLANKLASSGSAVAGAVTKAAYNAKDFAIPYANSAISQAGSVSSNAAGAVTKAAYTAKDFAVPYANSAISQANTLAAAAANGFDSTKSVAVPIASSLIDKAGQAGLSTLNGVSAIVSNPGAVLYGAGESISRLLSRN